MEEVGSFIGRGWKFPPTFGSLGRTVHMVAGEEEVNQGIEVLLKTQFGERMMHQDFGCNLDSYAFEDLSATLLSEIKGNIELAMIKYERRIEVLNIRVSTENQRMGVLNINIDYLIPDSNSRFNLVFPYYLEESSES